MNETNAVEILIDGVIYWTVERAAVALAKPKQSVYNALSEGKIKPDAYFGRSPLFLPAQVEAFAQRKRASTSPAGTVSTNELADALGVGRPFLVKYLHEHQIKPDLIVGNYHYYKKARIKQLSALASRKRAYRSHVSDGSDVNETNAE